MDSPDLAAVKVYLEATGLQYTDETISQAFDAEKVAQARVCRVGAPPQADLAEALRRRVVRNLAMRALPLGVTSDESGTTALGTNDPEIRRLEKPYRKLPKG